MAHSTVVRVLATIWAVSAACCAFSVSLVIQLILLALLAPIFYIYPKFKEELISIIPRYLQSLLMFKLNPFWKIHFIRPLPQSYTPKRTLIMLNHASALDPWLITYAIHPYFAKYVMKASLRKLPLFGWSSYVSNEIPIYFTKERGGWAVLPGSMSKTYKRCKEVIDMDIPLFIFPEGTRSVSGGLQPFKDGFFKFAIENKLEILPCAVHNCRSLWPLSGLLMDYGSAYVAFGDPFTVENMDLEEVKSKTWDAIFSLLKLSPEFDPEKEKPTGSIAVKREHHM